MRTGQEQQEIPGASDGSHKDQKSMPKQDEWRSRIGGDRWKNIIAEECSVVRSMKLAAPNLDPPLKSSPEFSYKRTATGKTPAGHCYRVSLAGREFLVGVPDTSTRIPCHLVLLTTEEEHVKGLFEFIPQYGADSKEPLVIWTSAWIWEELQITLSEKSENNPVYRSFQQRVKVITPEVAGPDFNPPAGPTVIACERDLNIPLTLGVRLSLSYVPSNMPSLRVIFQFNRKKVTIDPLGQVRNLATIADIRNKLYKKLALTPTLLPDFWKRYGDLEQEMDESAEPEDDFKDQAFASEFIDSKEYSRFKFEVNSATRSSLSSHPDLQPIPEVAPPQDMQQRIFSSMVVAILCGGLSGKRRKSLIDPSRVLTLYSETGDSGQDTRIHAFSIMVWRLLQLDAWRREYSGQSKALLPVLLITSPDSERVVKEQMQVFGKRLEASRLEPVLKIVLLTQKLVPLLNAEGTDLDAFSDGVWKGTGLDTFSDGGWKTEASGHLDSIRLLCQWYEMHHEHRLALLFAQNNLGALMNPRTLAILSELDRGKAHLATEIFELERAENDPDERWDLMSFWDEGQALRLLKQQYMKDGAPQSKSSKRYYSSMTWYANLEKLQPNLGECRPVLSRYIFVKTGTGTRPRQDLEQLSHCDPLSILWFYQEKKSKEHSVRGPYSHSRFLAVRTEDHIRSIEFHKAFRESLRDEVTLRDEYLRGGELSLDSTYPFLELIPSNKDYVWGGVEIAKLKGYPEYWRTHIAETWEASTHPSGPSQVYLNLNHPVPLAEALKIHRKSKKEGPHLSFMVKYLDCHEPLSIQIHPNKETAKWLNDENQKYLQLNLQDEWGKDESYYVLKPAAHRGLNLFLGFDRESLRSIADQLRPIIQEYAARKEISNLKDIYNKIITTLSQALQQECLRELDGKSKAEQTVRHRLQESLGSRLQDLQALQVLQDVLHFHVVEYPNRIGSQGPPLSFLGKEYLFAAIGLIWVIQLLKEVVKPISSSDKISSEEECVRSLLSYGSALPDDKKLKSHPILKYFHTEFVEQGQWCRVPAGTVHSWQGGGNLLVEVAQRSDNTFRILDFGRELDPSSSREMHYKEAMYALTEDGIVSPALANRLVFKAECGEEDQSWRQCHPALDYYLLSGQRTTWTTIPQRSGISVLLNPDNLIRIGVSVDQENVPFREQRVGPARATIILGPVKQENSLKALPAHGNDTLLLVSERPAENRLVCLSLGPSKIEMAWRSDQTSPGISWIHEPRKRLLEKDLEEILQKFAAIQEERRGQPGDLQNGRFQLGISWAGPIDENFLYITPTDMNPAFKWDKKDVLSKIFTATKDLIATEDAVFLTDGMAGALGEHQHNLGGLPGAEPGMILNIGSGICAGFYAGSGRPTDSALIKYSVVGRWLYVDPKTGDMKVHPSVYNAIDHIHNEPEGIARDSEGRLWIRSSIYLSVAGIALRFFSRAGDQHMKECGWLDPNLIARLQPKKNDRTPRAKGDDQIERFVEGVNYTRSHPEHFDRYSFCRKINELAQEPAQEPVEESGKNKQLTDARKRDCQIARTFIAELGSELATVVRNLWRQLPGESRDCVKRIVLTGVIGQNLGYWSSKDLLVEVMRRCLPGSEIQRSEISVACTRELEGFAYCRQQGQHAANN